MQRLTTDRGTCIAFLRERATHSSNARREPVLLIHGFASSHAVNWVFPQWVKTLTSDGRDVILYDLRGHGRSEKFYVPSDYSMEAFCGDAMALLDHLGVESADVIGYSLGARIAAFLERADPGRVRSLILGGLGTSLFEGEMLPAGIDEAMEASTLEDLTDPRQRMFRAFADATRSDRAALSACIRGCRQFMPLRDVRSIACPALIAIGSQDEIASGGAGLAKSIPNAQFLEIDGCDHNRAVGDRRFKASALRFLADCL